MDENNNTIVNMDDKMSAANNVKESANSILDKFKGDICVHTEECDLCAFLEGLTPNLFVSNVPVLLEPAFDTTPYENDIRQMQQSDRSKMAFSITFEGAQRETANYSLGHLNGVILDGIQHFENKIMKRESISLHEIPLVVYVNITADTGGGMLSHSHLMFIVNGRAYTLGLGQNKSSNTITIRSPDFNPYIKLIKDGETIGTSYSCSPYDYKQKKYSGTYIIKGVEPLTTDHYNNFSVFLDGKINGITVNEVSKSDVRGKKIKEQVWSIQTEIPYVMLNLFRGENCASFVSQMSFKDSLNNYSVANTICGMNNPSSSRHSENRGLLEFIRNVKTMKETADIDNKQMAEENAKKYLIDLYNKFKPSHIGGGTRRFRKKRRKQSRRLKKHKYKRNKKSKKLRKFRN
jgi:hypothetical protein